jgi:predicted phosphoadenosine phosphosulfate sulfurtransferase
MKWNHIILEGFCAKDWEYNWQCDEFCYTYKGEKKKNGKMKWEKIPNERYNPNAIKPMRPSFCKKRICYTCLKNDCEYLAYGKGKRKNVIRFSKSIKK